MFVLISQKNSPCLAASSAVDIRRGPFPVASVDRPGGVRVAVEDLATRAVLGRVVPRVVPSGPGAEVPEDVAACAVVAALAVHRPEVLACGVAEVVPEVLPVPVVAHSCVRWTVGVRRLATVLRGRRTLHRHVATLSTLGRPRRTVRMRWSLAGCHMGWALRWPGRRRLLRGKGEDVRGCRDRSPNGNAGEPFYGLRGGSCNRAGISRSAGRVNMVNGDPMMGGVPGVRFPLVDEKEEVVRDEGLE
ncbi:hypothetical protein pipiens_008041 [Culex pipiens pipiens]|uniref:Uncharacterized protein n=1 Tax=Culex pipiens pipiens TaxID=38569 RepID=A0ABD1DJ17_CULPP